MVLGGSLTTYGVYELSDHDSWSVVRFGRAALTVLLALIVIVALISFMFLINRLYLLLLITNGI